MGTRNDSYACQIGNGFIIMKMYMCVICGFIYDEKEGWPDDGIPAGTRWEDVPDDWQCPDCNADKFDFDMIEI